MSTNETPNPAADAKAQTVRLRRHLWDEDTIEVTLRKRRTYSEGYDTGHDVHAVVNGTEQFIGIVRRYTGSIDTRIKGTRLRRQGKRRTLWSAHAPTWDRPSNSIAARAEAIRDLIDAAERAGGK